MVYATGFSSIHRQGLSHQIRREMHHLSPQGLLSDDKNDRPVGRTRWTRRIPSVETLNSHRRSHRFGVRGSSGCSTLHPNTIPGHAKFATDDAAQRVTGTLVQVDVQLFRLVPMERSGFAKVMNAVLQKLPSRVAYLHKPSLLAC